VADKLNCSECGVVLAGDAKFCASCGKATDASAQSVEVAEPSVSPPENAAADIVPSPPPASEPVESSAPPAASSGDSAKRLWMIGGGVGIVVVIGVAVMMMSSGSKKKQRRASNPAPVDEPTAKVVPETPQPPEVVEAPIISVDGVTDFNLDYVPVKTRTNALKLNSKAVKQHGKKNYVEAIGFYKEALELWPGYIGARYNLACAFALVGDKERGLGLLKQLKEEGCVKCRQRVQKSRSDTDFQTLWDDDDFKSLAGDVHVSLPDYKTITKQLIRELGKGYFGLLVGAAKRDVTIDINGSDIRGKDQLSAYKINLMKTWARNMGDGESWRNYKPKFHPGDMYTYRLKCRGDCCNIRIPRDSRDSSLGEHVIGVLKKVCYWPTSETEAYPRFLKYSH